MVREHRDRKHVSIPLGLVALTWLQLYRPLLDADIPQSPINRGYQRLGFAGPALRKLGNVSLRDMRVGVRFSADVGAALHQALKDAAGNIVNMPVRYMTYPDGAPILRAKRSRRIVRPFELVLDEAYLSSFGEIRAPVALWQALQRFYPWIEPALVAEWTRLSKGYAARQERRLDEIAVSNAMAWTDPSRDVGAARERALSLVEQSGLHCVWSGKRLTAANLDVDHCFSWSVWPCSDLWNLMPAHRTVNQNEKRDLLPSDRMFRSAQERILHWWDSAYQAVPEDLLAERFGLEAAASLPGIVSGDLALSGRMDLEEVFAAADVQRIRLKHDQQAPEWTAERYLP